MNIIREDIDALNSVIKIDIQKDDYDNKVATILSNYRKTANIPGFRKGHVPMGLLKKQYGKAILVDEVNKLLQDALSKYLVEEKLDVLGKPLPKPQEDLDWSTEDFSFEFELGLAPKFKVQLKSKKAITHYNIIADDKMIDNQVKRIQKQYGKLVSQTHVEKDFEITGKFINEEKNIENVSTITLDKIKSKTFSKKILEAKVNHPIAIKTKGLFKEKQYLKDALKVSDEEAKSMDIEVIFEVLEIHKRELANLNQDLFDKLYGKGKIKTVTELKTKIKEDFEKKFAYQSDQKLLDDVTMYLVEHTKFDLPAEFLQKWMQTVGENPFTEDQAKEEYKKTKKNIRYQLIESKIIETYKLQIQFDELKAYVNTMIKTQMANFGQNNLSEKELEDISARILSNKDEVKRISKQLMSQKLLQLYKKEANLKTKKINYDAFIKEFYE